MCIMPRRSAQPEPPRRVAEACHRQAHFPAVEGGNRRRDRAVRPFERDAERTAVRVLDIGVLVADAAVDPVAERSARGLPRSG